jgi:5-methylcytosine-specific restriction endonuclease McrA
MTTLKSGFCGPQRGKVRPPQSPTGECGMVWAWVLEHPQASREDCLNWGATKGLNPSNVNQEYRRCHRWLKLGEAEEKNSDIVAKLNNLGNTIHLHGNEEKELEIPTSMEEIEINLALGISRSMQSSKQDRMNRLANASKTPEVVFVQSKAFLRNPDVVAEVLLRANGVCEQCGSNAPFLRAKDGTPYLEVHHRKPLADHGEDSVDNAIALCPNCHRKSHYG